MFGKLYGTFGWFYKWVCGQIKVWYGKNFYGEILSGGFKKIDLLM